MKNYKKIDHFESIVMKCTQEQFEEIRETLEKYGCVIDSVCLFKYHDYLTNRWCGKNKNIANHCNAHSSYFSKKLYEDWNAKTFLKACGIVETDPTTEVRNSVLLQLADNNSYSEEILKKECPKLFESEIEINNYYWVKHDNLQNALVFIQGKEVKHTYGFSHYFEFTDMYRNDLLHGTYKKDIIRKATPKEVETAFKDLFIKMGFVNGVRVLRNWCVTKEVEIVEGKIMYHSHSNAISISCREIFKDGKFAEIIETPTDIITIVEKYGKDKVISLIEKM